MDRIKYLDFELRISGQSGQYTAHVYHSPAGEASVPFSISLNPDRLDLLILRLTRIRGTVRGLASEEEAAAVELGGALFQAIFHGRVRDVLRSSLEQQAREPHTGLRIKLRLQDAPELAGLPWEFLYDADMERFLAKSNYTPVVRYIELPEKIPPLRAALPLNILGIVSAPEGPQRLDVVREQRVVEQSLQPLIEAGKVRITWLDEATLPALRRRLQAAEYHILHFIGHGGLDQKNEEGVLIFEDAQGRAHSVDARRLGELLHDHRSLRLAVLNACEGARSMRSDPFAGVATRLVQQGIPAVVAMQFSISDEAAVAFSGDFYHALANGFPVDAAVAEARKAINDFSDVEWATPVLFLRAGDGILFEMEGGDEAAAEGAGPVVTKIYNINTAGGMYVEGSISTEGGDLIGQDQVDTAEPAGIGMPGGIGMPSKVEGAARPAVPEQREEKLPAAVGAVRDGTPVQQLPSAANDQRPSAPADEPIGSAAWLRKNRRLLIGAGGILGAILLVVIGYLLFRPDPGQVAGITAVPSGTGAATTPAVVLVEHSVSPTEPPTHTPSPSQAPTATFTPSATPEPSTTPTHTITPSPEPQLDIGSTKIWKTDNMVSIYVPAGEFLMGSSAVDKSAVSNEMPQHRVKLSAFWIDRTEVTNAQYALCMKAGACQPPAETSSYTHASYYDNPEFANYPVIYVSWEKANAYCAWAGRRLPTEAEWEKAARGEKGQLFPWGNEVPGCTMANFGKDPEAKSYCVGDNSAVGRYPDGISPYGALNMAGNVWEWVADWYQKDYYSESPVTNPTGPGFGTYKVFRGGSWGDPWTRLRAAVRNQAVPDDSRDYLGIGIRCAATP